MALHAEGAGAISLPGGQAQVKTERVHTRARILAVDRRRIDRELAAGRIVIVAGFQGITDEEEITTLGRGGAGAAAGAPAAVLQAGPCHIYTGGEGGVAAGPRT